MFDSSSSVLSSRSAAHRSTSRRPNIPRARPGLAVLLLLAATAACRSNASEEPEGPNSAKATGATDAASSREPAARSGVRALGAPSAPRTVSVPGTDVAFAMVAVPGGELLGRTVEPFAIATLEVTWNQYMAMVAESEGPPASKDGTKIDGLARPTKPYIATDRGFGMGDRPVISISELGAESFCDWLSLRTGRRFRLPTATEWEWAARAGSPGDYADGRETDGLDQVAWFAANTRTTQPVGDKSPNAWGLFDVHGNVAEWARADEPAEGRWMQHVLCGGSYLDDADGLTLGARQVRDASWNMSDPQIPQSVWWLADAPWPGLRVAMDIE